MFKNGTNREQGSDGIDFRREGRSGFWYIENELRPLPCQVFFRSMAGKTRGIRLWPTWEGDPASPSS
jgi:hypothetical protein